MSEDIAEGMVCVRSAEQQIHRLCGEWKINKKEKFNLVSSPKCSKSEKHFQIWLWLSVDHLLWNCLNHKLRTASCLLKTSFIGKFCWSMKNKFFFLWIIVRRCCVADSKSLGRNLHGQLNQFDFYDRPVFGETDRLLDKKILRRSLSSIFKSRRGSRQISVAENRETFGEKEIASIEPLAVNSGDLPFDLHFLAISG